VVYGNLSWAVFSAYMALNFQVLILLSIIFGADQVKGLGYGDGSPTSGRRSLSTVSGCC
jgi:hypothetical protein